MTEQIPFDKFSRPGAKSDDSIVIYNSLQLFNIKSYLNSLWSCDMSEGEDDILILQKKMPRLYINFVNFI